LRILTIKVISGHSIRLVASILQVTGVKTMAEVFSVDWVECRAGRNPLATKDGVERTSKDENGLTPNLALPHTVLVETIDLVLNRGRQVTI
jgi:hypothetical protein